jgi:hypothetical protein
MLLTLALAKKQNLFRRDPRPRFGQPLAVELNEVTAAVVDSAYQLHREVGPGLFESVYELVLADMLTGRGITVSRQVSIPVRIKDKVYD